MLVLIILLCAAGTGLSVYIIIRLAQLPGLLPEPKSVALHLVPVLPGELTAGHPGKLLDTLYRRKADQHKHAPGDKLQTLRLVRYASGGNSSQVELMRSINTYLIRCHFTQPDTGWMRSTTERHLSQHDQQLKFALFVPLLLGALGRLIASPAEAAAGAWALGIGLLLTTTLIILYLAGHQQLAQRKNLFYDFLQNDLAQPMNASLDDSLLQLRNELHRFSSNLGLQVKELLNANKEQLSQVMSVQEKQVDSINRETAMLEKIAKMDFAQVVRFNTDVLNQLKSTLTDFGLFAHLASSLGGLLGVMDKLTTEVSRGVERTGEIGRIADAVYTTVQRNSQLQEFLTSNMKVLADRKELVQKTVGSIDEQLGKSLGEMRQHIQLQIESIRKMTLRENSQVEEAISAGRLRLEKIDRLDELAEEVQKLRKLNEAGKPVMDQVILQLTQLNSEAVKLRTTMEKRRLL